MPVEVSSRLLGEGDSGMVLSISRDITERERAEEALRAGRGQLENAMDVAGLVNWELDVKTGLYVQRPFLCPLRHERRTRRRLRDVGGHLRREVHPPR